MCLCFLLICGIIDIAISNLFERRGNVVMLQEILKRVTYPDEFFTELRGILPILSKEEKPIAKDLILHKDTLSLEDIEDILDVGVS